MFYWACIIDLHFTLKKSSGTKRQLEFTFPEHCTISRHPCSPHSREAWLYTHLGVTWRYCQPVNNELQDMPHLPPGTETIQQGTVAPACNTLLLISQDRNHTTTEKAKYRKPG